MKVAHERKSCTSLSFYAYVPPFIHCLYFIYTRKIYATVEIHPKSPLWSGKIDMRLDQVRVAYF